MGQPRDSTAVVRVFDWEDARERLRGVRARIDAIEDPPVHEVEAILHRRMEALAAPIAAEAAVETVDLVVFRVGSERFALEATDVDEVMRLSGLTALPGVPAFYRGLINHGGNVYPIVDLRPVLDMPAEEALTPIHAIIVVRGGDAIALAADALEPFGRIDKTDIALTSSDVRERRAVRGLVGESIVLLDIEAVLQDARLIVDYRPRVTENDGATT